MTSPTLQETAALAVRELDGCRTLLADADDWSAPTPCDGWDVEGLTRHLAAVAWQQAEAFHRARAGVGEAPGWLSASGDRATLLALLGASRAHLGAALETLDDPATTVPLPFAPLPALVPILAEKAPTSAITYRLRGDTATATVTYRDDAWHAGEGDGPVCDVHGSDAAISLLALGRIRPDHPSLTVNDRAAAAAIPDHIRGL